MKILFKFLILLSIAGIACNKDASSYYDTGKGGGKVNKDGTPLDIYINAIRSNQDTIKSINMFGVYKKKHVVFGLSFYNIPYINGIIPMTSLRFMSGTRRLDLSGTTLTYYSLCDEDCMGGAFGLSEGYELNSFRLSEVKGKKDRYRIDFSMVLERDTVLIKEDLVEHRDTLFLRDGFIEFNLD